MLKLGIVKYAALDRRRTLFGKRRLASVFLLRDLFERGVRHADDYDTIFRLLLGANGTWRDTRSGRFRALDRTIAEVVRARFGGGAVSVIDVGAASGATSVELYEALQGIAHVDLTAVDLTRDAVMVRSPRARCAVVFDEYGNELQHLVGPFVLPGPAPESAAYPVNRALRVASRRWVAPRARRAFARYDARTQREFETRAIDGWEVTRLPMLTGKCLRLERRGSGFRFRVADVLRELPGNHDVVRAMNVLSPGYFDEPKLRLGIRSCLRALRPGGVLVIGRSPTDDEADLRASLYGNDADGLRVLQRIGGGAEVDALVHEEATSFPGPETREAARG